MDLTNRLFLAVGLSDLARGDVVAALDGFAIPGSLVRPAGWHLTLRFLGSADEVATDRVTAAVAQSRLGAAFAMTLEGLGAFPNPRRATVIWLGVTRGEERLHQLADLCEEAAQTAGFPPEDRPFHPHLTLSRVRPTENVVDLLAQDPSPPVRTRVDRVTLFRSHLGQGGAVYEPLEEFPLA